MMLITSSVQVESITVIEIKLNIGIFSYQICNSIRKSRSLGERGV